MFGNASTQPVSVPTEMAEKKKLRGKTNTDCFFNQTLSQTEAATHVSVKCFLSCLQLKKLPRLLVVIGVDLLSMSEPVEVALHVIVHLRLHLVLLVHPPARRLRSLLRELSRKDAEDQIHHKKSTQNHLGEGVSKIGAYQIPG